MASKSKETWKCECGQPWKQKPKITLRNGIWCIRTPGYAGVWAWVNTFEGAVFEAIQLYEKGYRSHGIDGREY